MNTENQDVVLLDLLRQCRVLYYQSGNYHVFDKAFDDLLDHFEEYYYAFQTSDHFLLELIRKCYIRRVSQDWCRAQRHLFKFVLQHYDTLEDCLTPFDESPDWLQ
jgi:hypothetical protein